MYLWESVQIKPSAPLDSIALSAPTRFGWVY